MLLASVELDEVVEGEIESLAARRSQNPRARRRAAAARRAGAGTGEVAGRRRRRRGCLTHVAARLTDARLARRRCVQSHRSSQHAH